jgi:membrane protease YdiL (CAAX protease family)
MTTILTAVISGVAVLLAGNLPWVGLGGVLNQRMGVTVPWAILPMAVYLAVYWRFIGGRWGHPSSAASRRANLRANTLRPEMWGPSLAAGVLGFAALLAMLALAARLVRLPATPPIVMPPGMPAITALLLISMQSVVAGVTEEAAFRGYMQSPIERRYGLAPAILVNGAFFGLLHFSSHPADVLLMLPYYIAVAAVYGGLTWAADSILPALVLHSAGDVVVLTRLWLTGIPEWQLAAAPPPLVWEGGVDIAFAVTAIVLVALTAATARAYVGIRRSCERARQQQAASAV